MNSTTQAQALADQFPVTNRPSSEARDRVKARDLRPGQTIRFGTLQLEIRQVLQNTQVVKLYGSGSPGYYPNTIWEFRPDDEVEVSE